MFTARCRRKNEEKFDFLLKALRTGAPPHGGIRSAYRLVMLLGAESFGMYRVPRISAARPDDGRAGGGDGSCWKSHRYGKSSGGGGS